MTAPRCTCGRYMKILGARHIGKGYATTWYAVGLCSRCGESGIDWEWLGDLDPDAHTLATAHA